MCGRFSLNVPRDHLPHLPAYVANADNDRDTDSIDHWDSETTFIPRYNIAPHTQVPVIRRADPASAAHPQYILQTMTWGLVPRWNKTAHTPFNTINARAENLRQGSGLWTSIKGKRRCVVPAQGYYEWRTVGKEKSPYFIRRHDNALMLFAGLYECALIDGNPLWTFTIVTTIANKQLAWLHNRQPVILSTRCALDQWLDTSSQKWDPDLVQLLDPYDDHSGPLECYPVPKEVGKVGTESPSFIEPISKRKDGIDLFFKKSSSSQGSGRDVDGPAPKKMR